MVIEKGFELKILWKDFFMIFLNKKYFHVRYWKFSKIQFSKKMTKYLSA